MKHSITLRKVSSGLGQGILGDQFRTLPTSMHKVEPASPFLTPCQRSCGVTPGTFLLLKGATIVSLQCSRRKNNKPTSMGVSKYLKTCFKTTFYQNELEWMLFVYNSNS